MRRKVAAAALVLASIAMLGAAPAPAPEPEPAAVPDLRALEYWLDDYGIREAWQTTRGEGTRIAVIDTGVARGPVEFSGVVDGADFSGLGAADGRTPVGAVDAAHGSYVASLAAGRGTGADTGIIGVAPGAELLSVSLGFGAAAATPFADQVASAIRWAVDHGADVINLSFTTNTLDWPESWDDAFLYAFERDVVVIVAAGNRGSGTDRVGAPATIPGVLTVGGVDRSGAASVDASTQGITIAVSAPSEDLLGVSPDGSPVMWDGTSGAAPIVAGIAALVRAAHPDLDAANVINRIISTARPAPGTTRERDALYGYGLVNAAAAVTAPVAAVTENPMGSLSEWIRLYRRADATPTPEPSAQPVEVPPLPAPEAVTRTQSPLLPTENTLLYGSLPLTAATAAGILVALGVTAATRRIRSARTPRQPTRPI
ncbi:MULTISPECIES: S8 family serine peptidase [unclassified Microbacterium]|uniref:S8 family serine peptidase n=1 Tax=unclassified Microbacterium TaxID=2609290 RepID=UPI00214AE4C1|nr:MULTISPECIES: S8 family serine peptidase [unclassified Microbacterium]MCR2784342.1 S8 family serine peptidase [Microbacterium sp. zg.B96]WIM14832.1 S8 family serine peptidase [Microbacterium sp. zg-B96]